MVWEQFLILLVSLGGMFLWIKQDITANRVEASADRRDMLQLMRGIQEEIKDFHGRLCSIEERHKGSK